MATTWVNSSAGHPTAVQTAQNLSRDDKRVQPTALFARLGRDQVIVMAPLAYVLLEAHVSTTVED